jgi:cation diffusion facilitator CzcD-associated flavoprotein CzcO
MSVCDIAIVGAGPYGLSAAAHLRTVAGLDVRVFGEPMSFWDQNMPCGMFLRSNWTATQIASPNGGLSLEAFQAARNHRFFLPVPLNRFVEYGLWYQSHAVPDVDRRKVVAVRPAPKGFQVSLEDGESVVARRVALAAGIGSFAWRPPEFRELPSWLASHASEHRCLGQFAGQKVLVIGSGQSALESGALLHEGGAEVEIVGRANRICWLQGRLSRLLHHDLGKLTRRLLYAPTDVGPAGLSQLMARPNLLRRLPRHFQDKLRKRSVRPAGARWLVSRLQDVPIKLGCSVASVAPAGKRAKIRLEDGSERTVDHILMGTGYKVDISNYKFLDPELLQSIQCVNGYPTLSNGLESSVTGLHILGAPAARSFGPLMQFVSGTTFASRALLRSINGNAS